MKFPNEQGFPCYCAGNVLKAGVGCTPFGWSFPGPLWTGGVPDSEYLERSGILQDQEQLAEDDGGPPVCNVTDKGFKCEGAASAIQARLRN